MLIREFFVSRVVRQSANSDHRSPIVRILRVRRITFQTPVCHPRESGDPRNTPKNVDSRLRGNDGMNMNLTEIARRLNIPTNDLKMLLPAFGFGVGRRAIKVDKRIADKILQQGDLLKRAYEDHRRAAIEADKVVIPDSVPKELVVSPDMTVRDFATLLSIPVTKLVKELMKNGIIVTLNDHLDIDTATIIAQDLGRTVKRASSETSAAPAAALAR